MKSLVPAIAASFLTIVALAPSSLAANDFASAAGLPATQTSSAAPYPSIERAAPTHEMLAQMQSPDGAENQNDQGQATNPDDQSNNDQGNGDDAQQGNGDDAQQDNGDNAQNGDADGNGDADQNSNGDDNGDNSGQDNGDQQDPNAATPSLFSTTVH
jgi:hypothetical protein